MAITARLDQGCPLSRILYNFYNAALGKLVSKFPRQSLIPGFADDVAIYVCAKTFTAVCCNLGYIIRNGNGVLEWAETHNCNYTKDKWALVDFTHCQARNANRPLRGGTLRIDGNTTIAPTDLAKYLGVCLHYKLSWTEQWNMTIARGSAWVNAISQMMRSKMGICMQFARQVYQAVCLPRMLYGAEVFATPTRKQQPKIAHVPRDRAPGGFMAKLGSIQCRVLICIAGSMRTTAMSVLKAHLNIMPVDLHLDVVRHRALVCIATLPPTHPTHDALLNAQSTMRKTHVSTLTALACQYRVNPDLLKTVNVVCQHPAWKPLFDVHIHPDCKDAVVVNNLHAAMDDIVIYLDGSAHDSHIGAAAHLVRRNGTTRELKLYLGRNMHYTVHAAEGVGIILVAHLIRMEPNAPHRVSIGVDNQAVIMGCQRY
jgi:hypothetical protein